MATYSLANAIVADGANGLAYDPNGVRCSIEVDAAKILAGTQKVYNSSGVAVTPSSIAVSDIIELVAMPVGAYVDACEVYVHTLEALTMSLDIGITGVSSDGFFENADIDGTLGSNVDMNADYCGGGTTGGYFFATANTIDLLCITAGLSTAKFTVSFKAKMLRAELSAG